MNTPAVVFLRQKGLLAEGKQVPELCPEVSVWLNITYHSHQNQGEKKLHKQETDVRAGCVGKLP